MFKHFLNVFNGWGKQFEVAISLNHDLMTSFWLHKLHRTPKSEPSTVRLKLSKAATKNINGAWGMYLPIDFEDAANEKNEQEFSANQSEDEMSEGKSDSDSSLCIGSE